MKGMSEPRQRPIPVTREEREHLEEHKRRYQKASGERADWGRFLGTVTLMGLAALGVYGLARATRRSTNSVMVNCPGCGKDFPMALQQPEPRVAEAICPHCNAELVVDLGGWEVSLQHGRQAFTEWAGMCPNCGNREEVRFITRPPYWREMIGVVCGECGTEFTIRG